MKKFLFFCVISAALAAAFASQRWEKSQWIDVLLMPFHKDERSAEIPLKSGQSLRSFAKAMQERGIVADSRNFLFWLVRKGGDRSLKAGNYKVSSGPSWYVVDQLKDAEPAYFSATILPGSLPQTPFPFGSAEEQKAALSDSANFPEAVRGILPDAPEVRAAFLLPETYSLVERSLSELTKQASAAWCARFGSAVGDRARALRAAVVASLIQREAAKNEEYPVIAGVIENRLAKNMLLQIDAGVVYAWYLLTGETLKRVLFKHLEIDSPYNTYKHAGLPPAPICVPSAAAWKGALSPQKHDFYYYVAGEGGAHRFAKTQKEHERNVKAYRSRK